MEEGGLEESGALRVRAKRGCATHPRSIAERVTTIIFLGHILFISIYRK